MTSAKPDADFKLSITKALGDQLAAALQQLTPAPLNESALQALEPRAGVYELFAAPPAGEDFERGRDRLYVGKAARSLPVRLGNHRRKISGRQGIGGDTITFICLYVDEDLESSAPETMLIKAYREVGSTPWNNNGFGNKDPGRNRDKSAVKVNHFDARYPINLDVPLELELPERATAADLLAAMKTALPYNLRYDKKEIPTLRSVRPEIPHPGSPARDWMSAVIDSLPDGWQATALPGYVVVYIEPTANSYESAIAYWRRAAGQTVVAQPRPIYAAADSVDEPGDDEE